MTDIPEDESRQCVPIACPPMEEIEISFTVIRCPHCGQVPFCQPSMWSHHDRYEWTCSIHGVVAVYVRQPTGELKLEEDDAQAP